MTVIIGRHKILSAINSHAKEFGESHLVWKSLGLAYVHTSHKEHSVFTVIDKDLLIWSMIKYGFEVEQYNPNKKY
jgi:hypothetical protein